MICEVMIRNPDTGPPAMGEITRPSLLLRFGVFEVDLRARELRKGGLKIRLQDQPFQILAMLLEHPGEVVTRDELRQKLWPADTFVDFDHSLNTALTKIREALGDSADNPRFVETLPRRGYRFIAPVETLRRSVSTEKPALRQRRYSRRWLVALAAFAVVAIVAVAIALNVAGLRDRLVTAVGARHGVPLPKIESIAVLPLENLSRDPGQEYFADGMTDALITDLGKISALRVISRTSAMHYKGTKKRLPEIAKELNVDAVVEGTVQRSGDRVRITANLLHAPTDRHLWAESYERGLRDVLTLQSEVAQAIARQVQAKLTASEQQRLTAARPVDPEVYQACLRGKYYSAMETQEALETSLKYFRHAIEKDPAYAPAYVGLAGVYWHLAHFLYLADIDAHRERKAAALKAVELDDTLSEAHGTLAYLSSVYDYDQSAAERRYRRTIELNPSSAGAHWDYAYWLMAMGRHQEMLAELKRFDEIDPLGGAGGKPPFFYFFSGLYDRALEEAVRLVGREPSCGVCRWWLALSYEQKGMYEDAIRESEKAYELTGKSPLMLVSLAHTYAVAGRKEVARRLLARLEQRRLQGRYVSAYDIAVAYVGLGEKDRAFQWLDKAYEERADGLVLLKVDPRMAPLRSDPRFQNLLRRMNFPP